MRKLFNKLGEKVVNKKYAEIDLLMLAEKVMIHEVCRYPSLNKRFRFCD